MTTRSDTADLIVTALAAELTDDDFVGVGLGTPLALAAALLARATHAPELSILAGGALDVAGDMEAFLSGPSTMLGATPGFVPHFASMDMAERQEMTVQILRPAQIDRHGNLNTSRIGEIGSPRVRFPGGLATADVPSLLGRVVAYLPDHQPRNLPADVDFVTGSGAPTTAGPFTSLGVTTLITDLAVITFTPGGPVLASVHPWSSIDEVRSQTGFELGGVADIPQTPQPTAAGLGALQNVDPGRRRDHEIKTHRNHEVRT